MNSSKSGFTIIEILTVIAILAILTLMSVVGIRSFQKESALKNTSEEIVNSLRLAQNKALASEETSKWGIYFSTSSDPQEYALFKGESYTLRDPQKDIIYKIPQEVEIYGINLTASSSEVIFKRVTGITNYYGNVLLRLKDDVTKTKTILVESSGKVTSDEVAPPGQTNRITDSRHVHFDYGRQIDTLTESLTLTFFYNSSEVTKEIIIADYISSGQIYWEGEVNVNGDTQRVKIHTHLLNDINLDTQFCVHRDKRYNNKALTIEISGDGTGDLIQYDENGQTSKGTSTYVSDPIWQ